MCPSVHGGNMWDKCHVVFTFRFFSFSHADELRTNLQISSNSFSVKDFIASPRKIIL